MKANLSSNPTAGGAIRNAEIDRAIPPGLTLLGFRDASRLAFRDKHRADKSAPKLDANHVHATISGLVALGSIAMLALGR